MAASSSREPDPAEPTVLGLYEDEVLALHRVYLAARHLMLGGGFASDQEAALQALESAVLAAQDALPYELKGAP